MKRRYLEMIGKGTAKSGWQVSSVDRKTISSKIFIILEEVTKSSRQRWGGGVFNPVD